MNHMLWSIDLMCCRNWWLYSILMDWGIVDGLLFKLFHKQVGHKWTDRGTNNYTIYTFIIPTLEEEICIFEARFLR